MNTPLHYTKETTTPKILVEFSLVPESKATLQTFLETHFDALCRADETAQKELQRVIEETFPPESLAELRNILQGTSEYALLIHNCPEREGLESARFTSAKDAYSEHLGQALYQLCGASYWRTVPVLRSNHNPDRTAPIPGGAIHRDSFGRASTDSRGPFGEYIIFSAPYNGENGLTEVTNLKRAIESLDPEDRRTIMCVPKARATQLNRPMHLDDALRSLEESPQSERFIKQLELRQPLGEAKQRFTQKLAEHSIKVNLQPGELLVVNENALFHRGHPGTAEDIALIPAEHTHSRILLHSVGAPKKYTPTP